MSNDIHSIKKNILDQNKIFDEIEKELNIKELELLKKEKDFNDYQKKVIQKFDGKTTISEVVSYINSQYEELDKQISELENNCEQQNKEQYIESLHKLDIEIQNLIEEYSLDPYIESQNSDINCMEKSLVMSTEFE